MGTNKQQASELAREFWRNIDRKHALCDTCSTALHYGEGCLSNPGPGHGRSPDLLCSKCFEHYTWAAPYSGAVPKQDPLQGPLRELVESIATSEPKLYSISVPTALEVYAKFSNKPRHEFTVGDAIEAIVEGRRQQNDMVDRVFCYRSVSHDQEIRLRYCQGDTDSSIRANNANARDIELIFKDGQILNSSIPSYLRAALQDAIWPSEDEFERFLASSDIADVKTACQIVVKTRNPIYRRSLIRHIDDPKKNDLIASAIAEGGFHEAVPHLIVALAKSLQMDSPSDAHAEWIAHALQQLADIRAIDVLVDFLAHPRTVDKQLVDVTFFMLDRKRAISRLQRAWKDEVSDKVYLYQTMKELGCAPSPKEMARGDVRTGWLRRLVRWLP